MGIMSGGAFPPLAFVLGQGSITGLARHRWSDSEREKEGGLFEYD